MKAVKNDVEVKGMREYHIRDGVALCQNFAWLERSLKEGKAVDEISGDDRLEQLRSKQHKYMGLSFTTIRTQRIGDPLPSPVGNQSTHYRQGDEPVRLRRPIFVRPEYLFPKINI